MNKISYRFSLSSISNYLRLSKIVSVAVALGFASLSGCTDYWWQRGQPPAPATLFTRAQNRFEESAAEFGRLRPDILETAKGIKVSLQSSVETVNHNGTSQELSTPFADLTKNLIAIEPHLSVTSRAAYGELSSQFRVFKKSAQGPQKIDDQAYSLFAARVLMFLATELKVPAPVGPEQQAPA